MAEDRSSQTPKEKILSKIAVRFISPAGKRGMHFTDKVWTRGVAIVTNLRVWLVADGGKIAIAGQSIIRVGKELTKWNKPLMNNVLPIEHIKNNETLFTLIECSNSEDFKLIKTNILLLILSNMRLNFIHPATRGGVFVSGNKWQNSIIMPAQNELLVRGATMLIKIPYDSITKLEGISDEAGGSTTRQGQCLSIEHSESNELVATWVYASNDKIGTLRQFLTDKIPSYVIDADLSEMENEILMVLSTGEESSKAIEEALGLEPTETQSMIDRLMDLEIVELIRIRKDVRLTSKGIKYVGDLMKKQTMIE